MSMGSCSLLSCGTGEDRSFSLEDYEGAQARWCAGCGDHGILASNQRLIASEQLPPEKTVYVSGIGCSSRFPHYMKTYGFHGIHGRALPIATGVKLSRPDLHVFVVMGDGDCCSIGAGHWVHAIRYNVKMVAMLLDNNIYGLTKNQTSPTTPIGRKSKTDPRGAIDRPINPMAQLVASGASFIARSHATQVKHMNEMFERAILHPGFAVVETLSECSMFYPGAFDAGIPRKGGTFELVDETTQDMQSVTAAIELSQDNSPGKFGVYYEELRPTKNELEAAWVTDARAKVGDASDQDLMRQRFAAMR